MSLGNFDAGHIARGLYQPPVLWLSNKCSCPFNHHLPAFLTSISDNANFGVTETVNPMHFDKTLKPAGALFALAGLFILHVCLLEPARALADSPRTFSHPDRIRYDNQCLTIDGKDVFIYSGAFHYFRCPKELWPSRFQKIKDAGFNAVETYIPWNWSERQMPAGLDDFSKINLKDAEDWITMAEQFGFYVIIRPGPYICAEWDTGGFPQWLLTKRPGKDSPDGTWLRSDDPTYLAWCKHWYDAVCLMIAKHQITRKAPGQPGVILMQVENEYDYVHFSDEVKLKQIKALAGWARTNGIDVPLITCWTKQVRDQTDPLVREIFDCCNFYPRWDVNKIQKDIQKLRKEQPDAPLATTELQGGWFSQVGGKLSEDQEGVTASQINNLTLLTIQNGESLLNYYMLYGGINPGDWGAREMTTSYDYNAPIREWGGGGDRYQRVWEIGHMLQEHGARLARSTAVECKVTAPQKDVTVVMRRAPDSGRYIFVRTSQHTEPREGTARIAPKSGGENSEITFDYKLEPFGSKILYLPPGVNDPAQGEWLPKPAPAIERPTDLPSSVTITSARTRTDPGPKHWNKMKTGERLANAGIYDSHFIFYRANVSSPTATNLLVEYPDGDAVLALSNGKPLSHAAGGGNNSPFILPAGKNDVRLLYENLGHANIGPAMEQECGIAGIQLTDNASSGSKPIEGWRMHLVSRTRDIPELETNFDDSAWPAVSVENADQLTPDQIALFRAGVDLPAAHTNHGKLTLTLSRVDDHGYIYVNGQNIGRTSDWSRPFSFDVTKVLHPGHNVIAIVVKNDSGGGGLAKPTLTEVADGTPIRFESCGRPAGDEEEWWSPRLDDSKWQTMAIGGPNSAHQSDSPLTWYRMDFSLPSPKPGVWAPWRLHLNASGNGFLYLNGDPLGRYWDAGPQHDFYLPECWLKFGAGQTNNLTLNLRPVNGKAGIRSAIAEPYANFAEKR